MERDLLIQDNNTYFSIQLYFSSIKQYRSKLQKQIWKLLRDGRSKWKLGCGGGGGDWQIF